MSYVAVFLAPTPPCRPRSPPSRRKNANKNFLRVWPRAGFGLNQELLRHMALLGDVLVLDCNAQCVHQMGESAIGRCTAFREGLRRGVHNNKHGNLVANGRERSRNAAPRELCNATLHHQRRAHSIATSVRATLRHDTAGAFAQHMPWSGEPKDPPNDFVRCAEQFPALLFRHVASPRVHKIHCPPRPTTDPRRPLSIAAIWPSCPPRGMSLLLLILLLVPSGCCSY